MKRSPNTKNRTNNIYRYVHDYSLVDTGAGLEEVDTDDRSGARLKNLEVLLDVPGPSEDPNQFTTHFPCDVHVEWDGEAGL